MEKEHKSLWMLPFIIILLVSFAFIVGFTIYEKDMGGTRGSREFDYYSLNFGVVTAGTTAVAIPREGTYVIIKASAGNAGFVYVGDAGVTADKGYELDASETLTVDSYFPANSIYLIGSVADQKISYMIMN